MSEQTLKAQQKLQWLGLSQAAQSLSDVETEIDLLKEHLDSYEQFQDHLENGYDIDGDGNIEQITDFPSFKSYLVEIGFTSDEADIFIEKIRQNFEDTDGNGTVFDEFKQYAITEAQEFSTLDTAFGSSTSITGESQTENGVAASGIKFHESGGVTRNGVAVPPGTTEIYGRQVHFSRSAPPRGEDTGSGGGISYNNIDSDPAVPYTGDTVTISVEITNNYSTSATLSVSLKEDGSRVNDQSLEVGAGATETVSFPVVKNQYESHEYQIGKSETITVRWYPENSWGIY